MRVQGRRLFMRLPPMVTSLSLFGRLLLQFRWRDRTTLTDPYNAYKDLFGHPLH